MMNEIRAQTGPIVPDGPTPPAGSGLPGRAARGNPAGTDDAERAEDPKRKGGRRSYEEVLSENEALRQRVGEIVAILSPFAHIPDDGAKAAETTLYTLARGGQKTEITCGMIRAAKAALGMP